MPASGYVPLYQLTRGGIVESVHFGAAAVVDVNGNLLGAAGDPQTSTFLRSSAKPVQALPFVEHGGLEHFGLTAEETAFICASHSGTDEHAAVAARIQAKAGLRESDLHCGTHPPYHAETRARLQAAGEAPTANRHNCSGNHTGLLAYARMMGWPLESYTDPDHPVEQEVLQAMAEMSGLEPARITVGIDGCSVPAYGIPLFNAALAYARLGDPWGLPTSRAAACREITGAMMAHPAMVAGPEEFDTVLMQASGGRLFSKGGAEGYQAVGLLPGALGPGSPAIGIALKIADGGQRPGVRHAVTLEILRQLGFRTDPLPAEFGPVLTLRNLTDIEVGLASPCFKLT